jgi:hypothetical protein
MVSKALETDAPKDKIRFKVTIDCIVDVELNPDERHGSDPTEDDIVRCFSDLKDTVNDYEYLLTSGNIRVERVDN